MGVFLFPTSAQLCWLCECMAWAGSLLSMEALWLPILWQQLPYVGLSMAATQGFTGLPLMLQWCWHGFVFPVVALQSGVCDREYPSSLGHNWTSPPMHWQLFCFIYVLSFCLVFIFWICFIIQIGMCVCIYIYLWEVPAAISFFSFYQVLSSWPQFLEHLLFPPTHRHYSSLGNKLMVRLKLVRKIPARTDTGASRFSSVRAKGRRSQVKQLSEPAVE